MPSIVTLGAGSARAAGFYSLLGGNWVARFTATGSTSFSHDDMAVGPDGSIYVVGRIDGTIGSIMKLSSIGAAQWSYNVTSGANAVFITSVAARGSSVYVAVRYSTTLSGLMKLNAADGSVVWSITFSNFVFQRTVDVLVDSSENIYVVSNITINGPSDGFAIQKFSGSGAFLAGQTQTNSNSARYPVAGQAFLDEGAGALYIAATAFNTGTATNNLGPAVFRYAMSDLSLTASISLVTSSSPGTGYFCAPNPVGGISFGGSMSSGSSSYLFRANATANLATQSATDSITFSGDSLSASNKRLASAFVDSTGVVYAAGYYQTTTGRQSGVLTVGSTAFTVRQNSASWDEVINCRQHTDGSMLLQGRALNNSGTSLYNFLLKIPRNMTVTGAFPVGGVTITVASVTPTVNPLTTFASVPSGVSGAASGGVTTTPSNSTPTIGASTTTATSTKL